MCTFAETQREMRVAAVLTRMEQMRRKAADYENREVNGVCRLVERSVGWLGCHHVDGVRVAE